MTRKAEVPGDLDPRTLKTGNVDYRLFWDSPVHPVLLAGGFAVPGEMDVAARPLDDVYVRFHVVIEQGRARCNRIEIASDRPGGIGLDVLRKVGVRGLMTTALSDVLHDTLHAVQVRPDGTMALEKVSGRGAELSEEIQATVQQLVGWVRA
jgi:hypothetical protein